MADYKTHIDEKTGVTLIEVTGNISPDEQLSFMKSSSFSERTLRVVTDMRNASLEDMPQGTLAKLVRTSKPLSKTGIRAAYVYSKGDDFKKGKMVMAQIEALGYEGEFKVFVDVEKAISWVQE